MGVALAQPHQHPDRPVAVFEDAECLAEHGADRRAAARVHRPAGKVRAGQEIAGVDGAVCRGHLDRDDRCDRNRNLVSAHARDSEGDDSAHAELANAWNLLGYVHGIVLHYGDAGAAVEQVMEHARLAGDSRREAGGAIGYALAALHGPTPVPDAIACSERLLNAIGNRQAEGLVLGVVARLWAMQGDFEEARKLYSRARALLEELGGASGAALTVHPSAVEILAGDPGAAERDLRQEYETLSSLGEKFYLPLVTALLAQTLFAEGHQEEGGEFAELARELADQDDLEAQAIWRRVQARVLASRGKFDEAAPLAREAVELLNETDALVMQGDAFCDLAEVHAAAGCTDEAAATLEQALERYERKKNLVMIAHVRPRLEELRARVT